MIPIRLYANYMSSRGSASFTIKGFLYNIIVHSQSYLLKLDILNQPVLRILHEPVDLSIFSAGGVPDSLVSLSTIYPYCVRLLIRLMYGVSDSDVIVKSIAPWF